MGAWEGGISNVLASLGETSVASLRQQWPSWANRIDVFDRELARKEGCAETPQRWELFAGTLPAKRQAAHGQKVYANLTKKFHAGLTDEESLAVKHAGGPEAGSFLLDDGEGNVMSDINLRTAVRRRLRDARPAGGSGVFHLCTADRVMCGHIHGDDGGHHALSVNKGGGVVRRHNALRDGLLKWVRSLGIRAVREQEMPKWNKPGQEKAVLDIVYHDQHAGQVCVDVSVVDAVFPGATWRAGLALERREKAKHARYPGQGLYAFVVDTRGKWGREAHALVQSLVGRLEKAERVEMIRACRKFVAHALQTCVAEQLLVASSLQTMEGPRRARPQQPQTVGGVSAELSNLR